MVGSARPIRCGRQRLRVCVQGGKKGTMKRSLLFLLGLSLGFLAAAAVAVAQQSASGAGQRFALLIGNSAYPDATAPLVQPPKNVRALAEELRRGGFEVESRENLGREEMLRVIDAFKQKIRPGTAAPAGRVPLEQ